MKRILGGAALLAMMLLPGLISGGDKTPQEPFYRRYLIAGNVLDDRIRAQEKKIEADPQSADLHNDFGNLLAARRFPREAREQYEMAMKLDPHHFLAPYNLGLLYETQGQMGHAITAYEKSIDRNRGFPQSRFRLGRLYEKRGSKARAIAQYARALQIDPGLRDPKRNPLVVDIRLLDRVSLENYPSDIAAASMASGATYSDPSLARALPVDRTLSSEDLQPLPAEISGPPARPTPMRVIAPSTPPRREPVRPPGTAQAPYVPPVPLTNTPEVFEPPPGPTGTPARVLNPDAFVRAPPGAPPPPGIPPPTPTPD